MVRYGWNGTWKAQIIDLAETKSVPVSACAECHIFGVSELFSKHLIQSSFYHWKYNGFNVK